MNTTRHLFLTEPGFYTSRWQQAFPDADIVDSIDQLPRPAGNAASDMPTVAWLLTGMAGWESAAAGLAGDGVHVIAMSRQPEIDELRAALGQGARGYVHAVSPPALFVQAAQAVLSGGMWLPADVVNAVVRVLSSTVGRREPDGTADTAALAGLTQRERAVAEAVAAGFSNKEVARRLEITERTVKAHLSAAFRKLGVRDRMQLAVRLRASKGRHGDAGGLRSEP